MTTEGKGQSTELVLREEGDGSVVILDEPTGGTQNGTETDIDTRAQGGTADGQDDLDDETRGAVSGTDDEEEQGHAGETADEAEARRLRNRERRQQNKQRRQEHMESLRRELAARDRIIGEMQERLNVVERKSTGSEMAQLETVERELFATYNHYKALNQDAIEKANGALATEAQEKMFAAAQRLQQVQSIKKAMLKPQTQPQPLDPRLKQHAEAFMSKYSWYDPNGSDDDSFLTTQLDSRLAAEGWDPRTPEYWAELESRVKKYLPHRVNSGYNPGKQTEGGGRQGQSQGRGVPVAGSGGEKSGGKVAPKGYRLSPERVRALKDAGMWDDPKARAEAIRRFQQFDKEQGA